MYLSISCHREQRDCAQDMRTGCLCHLSASRASCLSVSKREEPKGDFQNLWLSNCYQILAEWQHRAATISFFSVPTARKPQQQECWALCCRGNREGLWEIRHWCHVLSGEVSAFSGKSQNIALTLAAMKSWNLIFCCIELCIDVYPTANGC